MRDPNQIDGTQTTQPATTPGDEKEHACDVKLDNHMIGVDSDDEHTENDHAGCMYAATDMWNCPNFHPIEDEDAPDVVECGYCGRMTWKENRSRG